MAKPKTPTIDRLLAAGIVWWKDQYELVGRATDGVVVTLGCVLDNKDLARLEEWLTEFDNPAKW